MRFNTVKIALTFAGCFLGAGYVSGQELWQFFVRFGAFGAIGLVLAMLLLALFGIMLMTLAGKTQISLADTLIIRKNNPFLRAFIGFSELFFLVGISIIMTSGTGALFDQLFELPSFATNAVFCIILFAIVSGGQRRMIEVFSFSVPLLVLFTIIIGILSAKTFNTSSNVLPIEQNTNPLIANWLVSAVTFVAYNLFSSVQILAPLGVAVNNRKMLFKGVLFGAGFLLIIAGCIFAALMFCPEACFTQLPMLTVAGYISYELSIVYAFMLFLGMLGTAASSLVASTHFISEKIRFGNKYIVSAILVVISYLGGMFGFAELIGIIYPICGYLGIIAVVSLAEHFIYIKKHKSDKRRI